MSKRFWGTRYKSFVDMRRLLLVLAAATLTGVIPAGADSTARQSLLEALAEKTRLYHVDTEDGRKTHLIYYAPVSVRVFWRFKTDFENDWLVTHKYIQAHRLTARHGNVVVSETQYTYGPETFFRWKTELFPAIYALRYTLLNPKECNQKFNQGWIRLEPVGDWTRVTHISHFDFAGAFLWSNLPGPWGMSAFMHYTANWEQETVLRLQHRYVD